MSSNFIVATYRDLFYPKFKGEIKVRDMCLNEVAKGSFDGSKITSLSSTDIEHPGVQVALNKMMHKLRDRNFVRYNSSQQNHTSVIDLFTKYGFHNVGSVNYPDMIRCNRCAHKDPLPLKERTTSEVKGFQIRKVVDDTITSLELVMEKKDKVVADVSYRGCKILGMHMRHNRDDLDLLLMQRLLKEMQDCRIIHNDAVALATNFSEVQAGIKYYTPHDERIIGLYRDHGFHEYSLDSTADKFVRETPMVRCNRCDI